MSLPRFSVLFLVVAVLISSHLQAQNVDDVHIVPRRAPGATGEPRTLPQPPTVAPELSVKLSSPSIIKNVDLVLVPVMVTNPLNQLVTGFRKENFRLYEGEQEQAIDYFSSEDAPLSLGIIFDVSASMVNKIDKAREAALDFFRISNPQDEFS